MAKNLAMSYLLDFYGEVLTEKQRDMMVQYYNDDLSLAEIADNFGITRQGVRDAIKRGEAVMQELDFQPNALGRAFYLSRKKNKIGILVAFREPDFQKQVMQGVNEGVVYAQQHGVEVLIEYAHPDDTEGYLASLRRLLDGGVRGLAIRGVLSDEIDRCLREISREQMQIVVYNEDIRDKSLRDCFVGQDSCRAGACAACLMEQIAGPGVDARHVSSEERLNGFAEYFRKRGTDVSHVIYGKGSHELTYRQTRDMIAAREHISGIFVSGAGLSGAAHAVDDAGLTGRIKVVGFDITESNMSFLKKGTVQFLIDQGPYMQGYRSVQLLTEAIFRDAPVETSFVDTGIQIKNPYNC